MDTRKNFWLSMLSENFRVSRVGVKGCSCGLRWIFKPESVHIKSSSTELPPWSSIYERTSLPENIVSKELPWLRNSGTSSLPVEISYSVSKKTILRPKEESVMLRKSPALSSCLRSPKETRFPDLHAFLALLILPETVKTTHGALASLRHCGGIAPATVDFRCSRLVSTALHEK